MPGRVLGHEGQKRWEGSWEPSGGWVVRGEGAGDPLGRKSSSVSAVGDDKGEACFPRSDGSWSGVEGVCAAPQDPVPKAVHAPEGAGVGGIEVGSVG